MALFRINEAFAKNGVGAGMTAEDLAKKHGVPVEAIEDQVEKGMKVELEHTSDLDKAREIAMDHLAEFPDYYDRLKKMEDEAKAAEAKLAEEFSAFLSNEIDPSKEEYISLISESQLSSDGDIRSWVDWKLTKFNLRSADDSFVNSFLEEVTGDRNKVASMTRRERVHDLMEAAEAMPRRLKDKLTEMDGIKGEKRARVVSSGLKSLKGSVNISENYKSEMDLAKEKYPKMESPIRDMMMERAQMVESLSKKHGLDSMDKGDYKSPYYKKLLEIEKQSDESVLRKHLPSEIMAFVSSKGPHFSKEHGVNFTMDFSLSPRLALSNLMQLAIGRKGSFFLNLKDKKIYVESRGSMSVFANNFAEMLNKLKSDQAESTKESEGNDLSKLPKFILSKKRVNFEGTNYVVDRESIKNIKADTGFSFTKEELENELDVKFYPNDEIFVVGYNEDEQSYLFLTQSGQFFAYEVD